MSDVRVKVKVDINTIRIQGRLEEFKRKLYPMVKTQVYKGAFKYTPFLNGDLVNSGNASAMDSTQYLIYNIAYAKYQYYANGMAPEDFPGRTKVTHPLASCLWIDKYMSAGGREDINHLLKNAPQILRF